MTRQERTREEDVVRVGVIVQAVTVLDVLRNLHDADKSNRSQRGGTQQ